MNGNKKSKQFFWSFGHLECVWRVAPMYVSCFNWINKYLRILIFIFLKWVVTNWCRTVSLSSHCHAQLPLTNNRSSLFFLCNHFALYPNTYTYIGILSCYAFALNGPYNCSTNITHTFNGICGKQHWAAATRSIQFNYQQFILKLENIIFENVVPLVNNIKWTLVGAHFIH